MKIFIVICFILFSHLLSAQNYLFSIGPTFERGEYTFPGISVKKLLPVESEKRTYAVEGILQMGHRERPGTGITCLFESHKKPIKHPNFSTYYGAGFHTGIWNYRSFDNHRIYYGQFGLDLVIGAEVEIIDQLILGANWNPQTNWYAFRLSSEVKLVDLNSFDFTIRYVPESGIKEPTPFLTE